MSRFQSAVLEKDELWQEAYLVYRDCQDHYNPNNGAVFPTFFSTCLRNHFVDLYRTRVQQRERTQLTLDITLDLPKEEREDFPYGFGSGGGSWATVLDLVSDYRWTPEQSIEWDGLVQDVEERLCLSALKVFRMMVYKPEELLKLSGNGKVTQAAVCQYFNLSQAAARPLIRSIKRAVLLALGKSPMDVHKALRRS